MSETLKPCPFCGGEVQLVRDYATSDGKLLWEDWHIFHRCAVFGAMKSPPYESPEIAKRIWAKLNRPTTHAVIVSDESTDCATGYCRCELCGEPIDQWDHYCRWCGAEVE